MTEHDERSGCPKSSSTGELVAPDEEHDPGGADESRRQFLRRSAQVGVLGAMTHFMLLGGPLKRALAADDGCEYKPPYTRAAGDICDPSDNNVDICVFVNRVEQGDECTHRLDTDMCLAAGGGGTEAEVGDACPGEAEADIDECVAHPHTAACGDVCCGMTDSGDVPDYS